MATSFQFLNGQIVETTTTTQYHDPQVLIQSLTDQKQNIADELANYTTVRLQEITDLETKINELNNLLK